MDLDHSANELGVPFWVVASSSTSRLVCRLSRKKAFGSFSSVFSNHPERKSPLRRAWCCIWCSCVQAHNLSCKTSLFPVLVRPRWEQASLSSLSFKVMICDFVGTHGNHAGRNLTSLTPPLLFTRGCVMAAAAADAAAAASKLSLAVLGRGAFCQVSPGMKSELFCCMGCCRSSERVACSSKTSKPSTRPSFSFSEAACKLLPLSMPLRTDSEVASDFELTGKKKSFGSSIEGGLPDAAIVHWFLLLSFLAATRYRDENNSDDGIVGWSANEAQNAASVESLGMPKVDGAAFLAIEKEGLHD
mmetsp:Transcript_18596/g.46134  ORF Transcript_18596/g.46134 Transcript_18596/m.46134 type:complete len:302 (-) Transcript_18596:37-942(-)